jgi:hypothetical protein
MTEQIVGTPEQQLEKLRHRAREFVGKLPVCSPEFHLELGWAANYDDLLGDVYEATSENSLLDRALRYGRAIVLGRGGSGKTCLLRRVAVRALRKNIVPVFVDLKRWTKADYGGWAASLNDVGVGAEFLIERFSQPTTTPVELDWLPPSSTKLMLVDGLNEISAPVGQQILLSLDEFVRTQIGTSVIVVDRLTRRELPSPTRWAICQVLPLQPQVIQQHSKGAFAGLPLARMLERPFFLDAAIRHGLDESFRHSRTPQELLERDTGLSSAQLQAAATAAFDAYHEGMTRTFPLGRFSEIAGDAVVEKLVAGNILLVDSGAAQFSHHLLHDALAAHYIAALDAEAWTSDALNAISFNASSFDTVALVFQQLKPSKADEFLRQVYDWNLYAAGYALSELSRESPGPSLEMVSIISAMLAEKRFDAVLATRQRANDGLLLCRLDWVAPFRDAPTLVAVFAAAEAVESNAQWFLSWRSVFTRVTGAPSDNELEMLKTADPIIGWTWANVLKRLAVPAMQQGMIRDMLSDQHASTIRWRAAHVLGAFPAEANMMSLLNVLGVHVPSSIRYGAVRSLIELAHRSDPPLRAAVVAALQERASLLMADDRVLTELMNAMIIVPEAAPVDWYGSIVIIAREMYLQSEQPSARDRWKRFVARAERQYSTTTA